MNAVNVTILKGHEVVIVKPKHESGRKAGYYELPGGEVEPGETEEQAVVRESFEETGLEMLERDLQKFGKYQFPIHKKGQRHDVTLTLYTCNEFNGFFRHEAETIPVWAQIPDVLDGKYAMMNVSEKLTDDVKKILKLHYFSTGVGYFSHLK